MYRSTCSGELSWCFILPFTFLLFLLSNLGLFSFVNVHCLPLGLTQIEQQLLDHLQWFTGGILSGLAEFAQHEMVQTVKI